MRRPAGCGPGMGYRPEQEQATMECEQIIRELKSRADPANVSGMARYGINTAAALGVSMPALRRLGKRIGPDHDLAVRLWDSGIHEARILAALVGEPRRVTRRQMDVWVRELDSWDICDQLCNILLRRTPHAWAKAVQWSGRKAEFVKRAGFTLMACLAVHDKAAGDERFLALLPLIVEEATDERNFVKKAVNWALRQIGKRSRLLNVVAVATAREIRKLDSKAARWIAADALRELTSEKTLKRL